MADNENTCSLPSNGNNDPVPAEEEPMSNFSVLVYGETQGTELEEAMEVVVPGPPFLPIVDRSEQWGREHGWTAPVQGQHQEMSLLGLMTYPLRSNQAARPRQEAPAPRPLNQSLNATLNATLNEALTILGNIDGDVL